MNINHLAKRFVSGTALVFIANLLTLNAFLWGQDADSSSSDAKIKEIVLQDIQTNLEKRAAELDSTVALLDKKVSNLDQVIQYTRDADQKADKLLERVKALENRQSALEESEVNVSVANYQSAIINLVSMEREIKPLLLFDASKNFFASLGETSDPFKYPGYTEWFGQFKRYIDGEKRKNANLMVLSNLLQLSGNVAKGAPLVGPLAQTTFTGITDFIGSLSSRQRELREQSENMFVLTAKLSQFAHDKEIIEAEWDAITSQLANLEKFYAELLSHNLALLSISEPAFEKDFAKEHDALKRTQFLITLSKISKQKILEEKEVNNQNWKEPFFYQQMDIQSLKIRFGEITGRIIKNFDRYDFLFEKYNNDQHLGNRIKLLESKLSEMKNIFDDTFDSEEYINSASRMYKVD